MEKKLQRSRVDRKIGGVLGGLGEYIGIDSTILRIIYVAITIFTMKSGLPILVYIIALFIIPSEKVTMEDVRERQAQKIADRYDRINRRIDRKRSGYSHHRHPRHSTAQGNHHAQKRTATSRPHFSKEFPFPEATFTNLILRVSHGDVVVRTWEKEEAKLRVLLSTQDNGGPVRHLSEEKIWDYFFSNTMLDISPDTLLFESKKDILKTDMVLTIPKRLYEQIKIQILNGKLRFDDVETDDIILKLRNGELRSRGVSGKFLNAELTEGEVYVQNCRVENVDISTRKGDITIQGNALTTAARTEQGDIDFILENDLASSVDLKAPNGDIRIQVPDSWNVDGSLHTKKEKIYFDLKNAKIWDNSEDTVVFTQNAEEISTSTLEAKVGKGIIKLSETKERSV